MVGLCRVFGLVCCEMCHSQQFTSLSMLIPSGFLLMRMATTPLCPSSLLVLLVNNTACSSFFSGLLFNFILCDAFSVLFSAIYQHFAKDTGDSNYIEFVALVQLSSCTILHQKSNLYKFSAEPATVVCQVRLGFVRFYEPISAGTFHPPV